MSKNVLRKDKTCLNCNFVVDQKFCPNCGQENTDTRKTFQHLFIHFFEDLTHYENAFWRTIINLLFKPATLTKEYLSGKRLSYLAPVRLYIFISFITFLLITLFPNKTYDSTKESHEKENIQKDSIKLSNSIKDNQDIKALLNSNSISSENKEAIQKILSNPKEKDPWRSIQEIDSIQKYAPQSKKLSDFSFWMNRKMQIIKDHNTDREILDKFTESFIHNLPKVLFIIMPFFAFFLWLFHSKKRWYYFDHGIFTLHYFSFLLLTFLILFSIGKIGDLINLSILKTIIQCFTFFGLFWMFYYFFPAHHRFYGETRTVSFLKSITLLFINSFFILFLLIAFVFYTFINLH